MSQQQLEFLNALANVPKDLSEVKTLVMSMRAEMLMVGLLLAILLIIIGHRAHKAKKAAEAVLAEWRSFKDALMLSGLVRRDAAPATNPQRDARGGADQPR